MNVLSKILIVTFVSISVNGIHADVQGDSVSTKGIVEISQKIDGDPLGESEGTGFFVGPHTLVTNFHVIQNFVGAVSDNLFIIHPETKERIPIHSIQALDYGNDLAVLHISEYESSVYYELFEGSIKSLSSSRVYSFNRTKESFPKLEGILSHQYPSEISSEKTLSLFTFKKEETKGLSGSPVLSTESKVIGVLSRAQFNLFQTTIFFSEIQNLKKLLSKPSLNCETSECIQEEIDKNNSKEAQYRRGIMVGNKNRKSGIEDLTKEEFGYDWFNKSAEQGFPPAMYELVYFHYHVDKNISMYKEWLTKAAQSNYGRAQYEMSMFLLGNQGDVDGGIKWAQKAIEHNYFVPLGILKHLVTKKTINEQDYRHYVEDFAERGHPEAQLEHAQYLFEEAQSDADRNKAMNFLKQVAKASYPPALYELSLVYEKGLYGVEQDIEKARNLERKSVELGYVPRDRQLVHKLIERGYFLNLDALEDFVAKEIINEQEYRRYVEDVAEKGYLEAQKKQIYYFISENNSDKNEIKVTMSLIMPIFERDGYPRALYGLSLFYQTDMVVKKDIKKARILNKKAIELGYKDGVVSRLTSHIQSVANQISVSCQQAFENLRVRKLK